MNTKGKNRKKQSRKPMKRTTQKRGRRKTLRVSRSARGPPELYLDLPMNEQIEKVLELVSSSPDKIYLNKELTDPKTKRVIMTNAQHWNKLTAWNADQILRGGNRSDMTNLIFMLSHPDLDVRAKNKKIWLDHILQNMFSNRLVTGIGEISNYPRIKHPGGKITLRNATIVLLEHRLLVDKWNTQRLQKKRPDTPYPAAAEPEPMPLEKPKPSVNELFNPREEEDVPDRWNASDNNSPELVEAKATNEIEAKAPNEKKFMALE